MPPILGLIPCRKQIFFIYIYINNVFICTYIVWFSGYWKKVLTIKVLFYCNGKILFTLLKAMKKPNQVMIQRGKSTVNQEYLITYLKPPPPPEPCYLQLVKDIKDQLAYNHAEGSQQVKWEAHASSPPVNMQECCISLLSWWLQSWMSPSKPHKDPFFPLVELR